jgi:hypothetical protein
LIELTETGAVLLRSAGLVISAECNGVGRRYRSQLLILPLWENRNVLLEHHHSRNIPIDFAPFQHSGIALVTVTSYPMFVAFVKCINEHEHGYPFPNQWTAGRFLVT